MHPMPGRRYAPSLPVGAQLIGMKFPTMAVGTPKLSLLMVKEKQHRMCRGSSAMAAAVPALVVADARPGSSS